MGVNTVSAVTMAGEETSRWEDVGEVGEGGQQWWLFSIFLHFSDLESKLKVSHKKEKKHAPVSTEV